KMIFREAILNRPHSWKATTFADTLWMGRHLAQISEAEIKRAVARTNWPDFMQTVYVSKLRARQLRILSALGLAAQNAEEQI
ncbi:hypothetical protein ACQUZI_10200, partial [Streptococcus pyogenes]|uniref:hypothetical protein n=1 Tax=Streptococcus pyogenes TaxID=1314 RepID=UPI003D9FC362